MTTAVTSTEELIRVVIRFAGDSGDGMQLTGDRFTQETADYDILTPGDRPDVLVATNSAALKANIADLQSGGTAIIDAHEPPRRCRFAPSPSSG